MLVLFWVLTSPQTATLVEIELWCLAASEVRFSLLLDFFSLTFLLCVVLITFRVITFSVSYMWESSSSRAFHLIVARFVSSMLALILRPNLITLMLGWDGLGISSFFLVIFYKRNKAFNAGLLTAISNRVGDALILISLSLGLFYSSFSFLPASQSLTDSPIVLLICLRVAACTKSAQIPFSAWLPAAMAAPTPVSALVHSSTLVTAGVYLLLRIVPLITASLRLTLVGLIGAITITIASLRAFLESDLKKIVALSTLSQLGIIILSLSLGLPTIAFFHLVVHAFFKALLFIATGNLIHNSSDYQDLRRMGGHLPALPVTQATVIITKLSLCGVPFFSAFFSKELVLERLRSNSGGEFFVYVIIWTGVLYTALYSLRFIYYILKTSRSNALLWKSDNDLPIIFSIIILYFPRFFTGKLLNFYLLDSLRLPITSFLSKAVVISLLIIWAPLAIASFSFIASWGAQKSLMYLWLLRRWRGPFPLKLFSSQLYALVWASRFGWKDLVLRAWTLTLSRRSSSRVAQSSQQFFKTAIGAFLMLILWTVL